MSEEIEHLSSGLLAAVGNEVGWRRSPERDVRCHQLDPSPEVPLRPLGEQGPHQFDFLLRHRPRSISPHRRAAGLARPAARAAAARAAGFRFGFIADGSPVTLGEDPHLLGRQQRGEGRAREPSCRQRPRAQGSFIPILVTRQPVRLWTAASGVSPRANASLASGPLSHVATHASALGLNQALTRSGPPFKCGLPGGTSTFDFLLRRARRHIRPRCPEVSMPRATVERR